MQRRKCPICNTRIIIDARGPTGGILLAGEFPGYLEKIQGMPWVGPASKVLRSEMARIGMSMDQCRLTNLWLHDKTEEEGEMNWHLKQLIEEMKQARAVLLMGSELAPLLFDHPVSEITGLTNLPSSLIPKNVKVVGVSINPASVIAGNDGGVVGELRLALRNFNRALASNESGRESLYGW